MLSNTARNSFTTAQAAYLKRGEVLARFKQFTAEKAPYLFTCDPYKIFTGCPVSSSKFPRPITGKWSEETLEIPMFFIASNTNWSKIRKGHMVPPKDKRDVTLHGWLYKHKVTKILGSILGRTKWIVLCLFRY